MSENLLDYCLAYILQLVDLLIALARLVLVRLPASAMALVACRVGNGVAVLARAHDQMWRCGIARSWLVVG